MPSRVPSSTTPITASSGGQGNNWRTSHANFLLPVGGGSKRGGESPLPPRTDIDVMAQKQLLMKLANESRHAFVAQHTQNCQLTRDVRKAMLCRQVVEAYRYQRGFFDEKLEPRPLLLTAKQQAVSTAKVSALPTKKSRGACRRPSPDPNEAVQNTTTVCSFMLLDPKKVKVLLNDIHIILSPTQPADYSEDVSRQLGGLYLFQPTGFSFDSAVDSATTNTA